MRKKDLIIKIKKLIKENGSFTTADVYATSSPLISSTKKTYILAEKFYVNSCEGVSYVNDIEVDSDDYEYEDLTMNTLYEILSLAEEWDAICYKTLKRCSNE